LSPDVALGRDRDLISKLHLPWHLSCLNVRPIPGHIKARPALYPVRFKEVVYVLHAFQKKSPKGIKTAQIDIDLVERRLKVAQQDYEARHGKPKH
jgi:hypothetical protein